MRGAPRGDGEGMVRTSFATSQSTVVSRSAAPGLPVRDARKPSCATITVSGRTTLSVSRHAPTAAESHIQKIDRGGRTRALRAATEQGELCRRPSSQNEVRAAPSQPQAPSRRVPGALPS